MTRYFVTNNLYRLEDAETAGEYPKIYRWSNSLPDGRKGWLYRPGFKPSDLTDHDVIGAVEITEEQATAKIVEITSEGAAK